MAYLSDFHCHSDISPDSRTDLVDLVQAAADKGVAELCVTEHWECGSPCMDWQLRKKPFDFTRYLERYEAAQRALGHRVKLRLGLLAAISASDVPTMETVIRSTAVIKR